MPAETKNQRTLACIALSMKEGKTPHSYSKEGHKMMMSMSMEQLKDMCEMESKEEK